MAEAVGDHLHIVMFPFFAMGHLRPFFRLSRLLARMGHRISFISTPRNLRRLPKLPSDVSQSIHFVEIPFPHVHDLPPEAESSMDIPHLKQQLLKIAIDLLEPKVRKFLQEANPKPDWVVYDYASHWLPSIAQEMGISRAFFSLFTAAFLAFLGPPSLNISQGCGRFTAEDFTVVPKWIPFHSNMAFRIHEMVKNMEKDSGVNAYDSGASDTVRFNGSIEGSDIVILRSCNEIEPEWLELVNQLYQKPVIPIGVLPVEGEESEFEQNDDWMKIKDWLDQQKQGSVVYVAFGTEASLSKKEVHELALGLEQCGLPFLWVINKEENLAMLPDGYLKRLENRGKVYPKWAPQVYILSHGAVGGFLTHCGWNSVTEALCYGRVLILFPVMNEQGLNTRLLSDKKLGIDIPREEKDGAFLSDDVVQTLRFAMVDEEGACLRENASNMKCLLMDKEKNESYVHNLLHHLISIRRGRE